MALSTTKVKNTTMAGSVERQTAVTVNDLADAVRAICVSLDADSGVTITTLTATFDAALTKVADQDGTEL